eukprot:TRINITY_DN9976_c0_g1_i2.p1 TRINITY_DN9976_c0_g1~~TRINITY_DN9976_c0_g1_i2.p1  ORF type:complete len:220 (-),score=37.93 TRINITY_DN9976_c0_g1_i2:47-685(-)
MAENRSPVRRRSRSDDEDDRQAKRERQEQPAVPAPPAPPVDDVPPPPPSTEECPPPPAVPYDELQARLQQHIQTKGRGSKKAEDRAKQEVEAQKARQRFEEKKKEMEAKMAAAQQQVKESSQARTRTANERAMTEDELLTATRGRAHSAKELPNEELLRATGNKRQDSQAAKDFVMQKQHALMASVGIKGFGKDSKDMSRGPAAATCNFKYV